MSMLWSPKEGEGFPTEADAISQLDAFFNENLSVDPHPMVLAAGLAAAAWKLLLDNCKERSNLPPFKADGLVKYTKALVKWVETTDAVPPPELSAGFQGMRRLVSDIRGAEATRDDVAEKVSFFTLFRYATKTDIACLIFALLAAFLQGGSLPAFSIIWGEMIDSMLPDTTVATTTVTPSPEFFVAMGDYWNDRLITEMSNFCLYMVYIGIAAFVLGTVQITFAILPARRQVAAMRRAAFAAALRQDLGWFDMPGRTASSVALQLQTDTSKVHLAIGEKLSNAVFNTATAVIGVAVAIWLNWKVALVVLAVMPLLSTAGAFMGISTSKGDELAAVAYARAGAWASEALRGVRTVVAMNSQDVMTLRYSRLLELNRGANVRRATFLSLGFGLMFAIFFLTYALGLWWGAQVVDQGGETAGSVVAAFFSIVMGLFSLGQVGTNVSDISTGRASAFRVFNMIDRVPTIAGPGAAGAGAAKIETDTQDVAMTTSGASPAAGGVAIEFQNVVFAYPNALERTVLDGVTLRIEAGQRVAFVGHSGSGKSSLLSLVARMYDPVSGYILVDGKRIAPEADPQPDASRRAVAKPELSLKELRRLIGFVGQEPVLFSGTVRENLGLALFGASEAVMWGALEAADVADTIRKLPLGLDTYVGDSGTLLSGGQKQRVAIARALIKNPRLLLLDEATSALDRGSESRVQAALDRASLGRTTLVVAHRLVTIMNADRIFVVSPDTHNISEAGTHAELLALRGVYYQMAAAQGIAGDVTTVPSTPAVVEGSAFAGAASLAEAHTHGVADTEVGDAPIVAVDKPEYAATVAAHPPVRGAAMLAVTPGDVRSADDVPRKSSEVDIALAPAVPAGMNNSAAVVAAADSAVAAAEEDENIPGAMGAVARLALQHWVFVGLGLIGSAVAGLANPIFAILFTRLVEALTPTTVDRDYKIALYSLLFVALAVACFISNFAQIFFFAVVGDRVTKRIREIVFATFLHAPIGVFDRPETSPSAASSLLTDSADKVQALFGPQLGAYIRVASGLIAGLIIAFYYSWELTLVLLALVPFMGVSSVVQMKFFAGGAEDLDSDKSAREEAQKKKAKAAKERAADIAAGKPVPPLVEEDEPAPPATIGSVALECVSNVRTVQMLSLERPLKERYAAALERSLRTETRNAWMAGIFFGISQFLVQVIFAIAFFFGGRVLMALGRATFDDVMTAAMALLMSAMGAGEASQFAGPVAEAKVAAAKLIPLMIRYPPPDRSAVDMLGTRGEPSEATIRRITESTARPPLEGDIRLDHVQFAYPTRPKALVLKTLSLHVPRGQHVAIIGSTGSGKSTIAALIEGFYEPLSGSVFFDNVPSGDLPLRWLRTQIGYVPQEPCLFDISVMDNLRLGAPATITDEEIFAACRAANIHDTIMTLPGGYAASVGPYGGRLSGGQKQRLAIARALARDPKVLILDEATAALDATSESVVQAAIDQIIQERSLTVVTIAHRLSAIRTANYVIVLEEGVVIERGPIEELLAAGGPFAARWKAFYSSA